MIEKARTWKQKLQTIIIILCFAAIVLAVVLRGSGQQPLADSIRKKITSRSLLTTGTNRSALVTTYCSSTSSNITSQQRSNNRMYNSSLSPYFKANATIILNNLVKGQLGDILTELQIEGIGTFVFISPFVVGLILIILLSPCFFCCCTCQNTCPPQCCRSASPYYTNQQLTWVTVFLVLTSLLIICTAVPSLTNSNAYFRDFNCQVAQFLDNFQNGNQTADQNYFFSGISTIRQQLINVLSPGINVVSSQISKLSGSPSSVLDTAKTQVNTAMTSIQLTPNGGNTIPMTLNYNYPLQSSTATSTLSSNLVSSIGSFSINTSLLGDFYTYMNTLYTNLTMITTAASGVSPHLNSSDFGAHLTATDAILAQVQTNLEGLTYTFSSVLNTLSTIDTLISTYSMLLYGITLGLALLTLIGIILVKSCKAIGCRHFLYLICFASFFIGVVLFAFAVLLASLMSFNYYTCSYTSTSFTNPLSFTNSIVNIFGTKYSSLPSYFSQCFGGSNDFITMIDPTLSGYFSNLKTSIFNSKLYNFTDLRSNLDAKLTTMSTLIDFVGLGRIPDFDVTTANGLSEMSYFNTVANKSLFSTSCPSSTYSVFYQDAWVPGVSSTYQSLVSCQNKVSEDATVCTTGIGNVSTCPTSRCIDTFSIISLYYRNGTIGNLITDANTRYNLPCTTFNNFLTNFANNYVQIVNDKIGNSAQDTANSSKLAGRFQINTKAPSQTVKNYMNSTVQPLFTQAYGNLSSLDSVFNPTTGLLTGLDCRVLSQTGVNMQQALCIRSFNRIFFTLVTVGIMAFGMFTLVCCILCFNVRHYQFSLQGKSRNKVLPLDETDSHIVMD